MSKNKQSSIFSFMTKKAKLDEDGNTVEAPIPEAAEEENISDFGLDEDVENSSSKSRDRSEKQLKPVKTNDSDVGTFIGITNIPDKIKNTLLTNPWIPDKNYSFPKEGTRNLRFKHYWLNSYEWLVYSEVENGALCKYCVVFANEAVGKGDHVKLGN